MPDGRMAWENCMNERNKNARTREMQTLDYIQSALLSCRDQAAAERHVMLAYLIEMAYVEASDLLRRLNDENKAN
jgi:hypothetical protein